MVQLAFAVIPPSHQRLDLTGMRIQNDHGHLRLRRGLPFFAPSRIAFSQLSINIFYANIHGLRGCVLQLRIQRCVDAKTLGKQLRFGKAIQQVFLHHVHKERRGASFEAGANDQQRNFFGIAGLLGSNRLIFRHGQQGAVAGLDGAFRFVLRS